MTFPETVKTTLWDIIDEMSLSISSFANNPDKDFLRRRKLDFKNMIFLPLQVLHFISNVRNCQFLLSVIF
ncbi:hypothetical protein [Fusicatenibacter faecihominis]|jgi:hypothetical protein|uniref:Uncharacterized protein n=1 Tax=Fusicatenibacter faecihominis TaxID=2881276 RepID=A0AAE3DTG9_9FIRM|nr:hypothetical protein [Fusicatenibacter faecihominis]MCC2190114.1 hypothetical protein [Fusicatenibacter faecihominis]